MTPVMYLDPSGETFIGILATIALGAFIGGLTGLISAAITGDDLWAGFVSGAVSGAIITTGVAIALTVPMVGGTLISAGAGFTGGFLGEVINQGMNNGWSDLDYGHAFKVGAVTGAITVLSFGISSYIYRSTPSIFSNVYNQSVPWLSRVNNSLSMNVYSYFLATTHGAIGSLGNSVLNLFVKENNKIKIDSIVPLIRRAF